MNEDLVVPRNGESKVPKIPAQTEWVVRRPYDAPEVVRGHNIRLAEGVLCVMRYASVLEADGSYTITEEVTRLFNEWTDVERLDIAVTIGYSQAN